MTAWLRGIVAVVVLAILGGLVAGCEGGGGGVVRVYLGINGQGDCSTLLLEIDLQSGGAVVARKGDGSFDCVLDAALDANGCEATFAESDDGEFFEVTVSGCTIPDVGSVVRCGFDEIDLSGAVSIAECACTVFPCDFTPPVCLSEDADPGSCEICDNVIDDDANGLVDCHDPNCDNDPICSLTTTTNSHRSTTTTVTIQTTSTIDTTSTTLALSVGCTLIFRLADDVTVGSLQWSTDYSAAPGFLVGEGATAECATLVIDSLAAFNDTDSEKSLEAGLIKVDGFTGPINVAECLFRFLGQSVPHVDQFAIGDVEAAAPDLTLIVPAPEVVIDSIECPPHVDGSTSTTSTTTLPEASAIVRFRLDSASSGLGALQFAADYSGAAGGFQGSGAAVACTNEVVGALFAQNDDEAQERLTLGLIALSPFSAPIDLVECRFEGGMPASGDFQVTIEDATDIDGEPATAAISVAVTPAP